MDKKPTLQGLCLKPCCRKALRDIDDKTEMGQLLRAILPTSALVTMLGSNPLEVLYTVFSTDWDGLVEATRSVPEIVRSSCLKVAEFEYLDHPAGALNHFWDAMCDVYR